MRARLALEGLGAALLLLFSDYLSFFHPQNHDLFHHGLPVTHLIEGLLLDFLFLTIVVSALLAIAGKIPSAYRKYIQALFTGVIIWRMIQIALLLLFRTLFPVAQIENLWSHSLIVILCIACGLAFFAPRYSQVTYNGVRFFLAALSFSSLWIVPHLVVVALANPYIENAPQIPKLTSASFTPGPRIVWILFDELSYDQTFEHRSAEVQLPNFDSFRASSMNFSNVLPIGYFTDRIIPSLFLGKTFTDFQSTPSGKLLYREQPNGQWVQFDSSQTIFAVAKQQGWKSAIDGWYNPTCRILSTELASCGWSPGVKLPLEDYGASENHSAALNAMALVRQLGAFLSDRQVDPADFHEKSYRDVMARAQTLIADPNFRFIYIHFPVPHPPAIYDRKTHVFRRGGNYLDNLALSDEALGILLRQINASPLADRTTVIVTSDHSWRTAIYRERPDWTPEEERITDGKFDDRPVLLVHLPGASTPKEVTTPVSEMLEHDLIVGMLTGQINQPKDLEALVVRADGSKQADKIAARIP